MMMTVTAVIRTMMIAVIRTMTDNNGDKDENIN